MMTASLTGRNSFQCYKDGTSFHLNDNKNNNYNNGACVASYHVTLYNECTSCISVPDWLHLSASVRIKAIKIPDVQIWIDFRPLCSVYGGKNNGKCKLSIGTFQLSQVSRLQICLSHSLELSGETSQTFLIWDWETVGRTSSFKLNTFIKVVNRW